MRQKSTHSPQDHVPGSMQEAAVRAYFERGSKEAIERNMWKLTAIISIIVAGVAATSTVLIALKQEVHVFQVAKLDSAELQVVAAAKKFTADEETQMAWASRWLGELTEISPSLWKRNLTVMQSKVSGVAADQAMEYLGRPDNNPASLTSQFGSYIREYERRSVNKISDMTYLVRYDLISRPAPGAPSVRRSFAATVTLASIGHRNQEDVFRNPEGLAITSFSISEETK